MNIKTLIFSNDPKQALRIRRLFAANIAYLLVAFMTSYAIYFGHLRAFPQLSIFIVPLIPNILFYPIIRSRLNLILKDPSLTVPQTVYAICSYMYLIYFADEVRGAFLMLVLSVPIGIALRVRPKKLFWISLLPLLLLGGIIIWQSFISLPTRDPALAVLEWIALAGGVGWLTVDSTYMARKRQETIDTNRSLELAIEQNLRLIENLTQQKEIAEAANQSNIEKSRLLAAANHDLRQPLHALSLFVAQLKECDTQNNREVITENIEASITNINELFSDLLDISKLDAGIVTPNITAIAIQPIFNRLKNTFEGIAHKNNLEIKFVNTHATVLSEALLLERILMNLISNALRYTEKGRILVGCRKKQDAWIIQVWDTGQGIDSNYFSDIFKEYKRIPTTIDRQTPGLGLGLAIVDKLSRLLNHKVSVSSVVNKGSCFSITLNATSTFEEIIDPKIIEQNSQTPKQCILFIDDDLQVQEAMRGLLSAWGYKILLASDEEDALREITQASLAPDLIISDITLQNNKNGMDVINGLRRTLGKSFPAFLISGNTHPEILQLANTMGLSVYHKPLKPITLRALINKYCS